ncbi:hypothetical protein [Pleurocapsa sp. PCC 7319]|uniref:hypothetical protein n=1 Tax=Pleurocapsa sp. PCC 7319 TaxID=118161 RepID=UPI0003484F7F|nr:hypothetical protein [Pleurocapsa sp. PCC 7319]
MNPNEDFCDFSVKKWQGIQALAKKMQTLSSLLDVFDSNEIKAQPLANDCQSLADSLKADLKNAIETLVELIEVENVVE